MIANKFLCAKIVVPAFLAFSACVILSSGTASALTTSQDIDQLQQEAEAADAAASEADFTVDIDDELLWEADDNLNACKSSCGDAQQAYQAASDTYNAAVMADQTAQLNAAAADINYQTAVNGG